MKARSRRIWLLASLLGPVLAGASLTASRAGPWREPGPPRTLAESEAETAEIQAPRTPPTRTLSEATRDESASDSAREGSREEASENPPIDGGDAWGRRREAVRRQARVDAEALYLEGKARENEGKHAEAAKLFEQALDFDPDHGDARVALGWARYRNGEFERARAAFEEASKREPKRADVWTGLGYARMQLDDATGAERAFARARGLAPDDPDALLGAGLWLLRSGRASEAVPLLRRAAERSPGNAEAAHALARALSSSGGARDRRISPPAPKTTIDVPVRCGKRYLEVREKNAWKALYLKGVNLGVALPGKFPSEFPEDEALYRDWLSKIRAMNANVVRLYTLLPPVFYRVLARENLDHPATPVYLIQGVWVELPPGDDFHDAAFNAEYDDEIRRVIDAVHGNIEVAPRAGHAAGRFDADVSPWLLAMILGREWEPYAVESYDGSRDASRGFDGRYVRAPSPPATPTEMWIASTLEVAAAHEAESYGESRPLAFTNWPTLDPIAHPTEASRREEDAIRLRRGETPRPFRGVVYDNDSVSVDAEHIGATERWPAGLFASYHAYPYFPDFMILDPRYLQARDSKGPNAYAGYLRDLVGHHAGRPVLIAETGVPTSRGVSHSQPQGFDHGGHDETEQAVIDARLVETAHETGCAGAIVFSWLDEWFKRNWLVADLEAPPSRGPLWLNALDPEQHFGILEAAPGPTRGGIVLDGKTDDWSGIAPIFPPRDGPIRALYAASDEAYLYLRLDTGPAPPATPESNTGTRPEARPGSSPAPKPATTADLGPEAGPTSKPRARPEPDSGTRPETRPGSGGRIYWIGIDTYDRRRGSRRLPGLGDWRTPTGIEFALRLGPGGAAVVKTDPSASSGPSGRAGGGGGGGSGTPDGGSGGVDRGVSPVPDGRAGGAGRGNRGANDGVGDGVDTILVDESYDIGSHRNSGPYTSVVEDAGRFIPIEVEIRMERIGRDGTVFPAERHVLSTLRRGSTDPASPVWSSLADEFHDPARGLYEIRLPWNLLNVTDPSSRRVVDQTGSHPPPIDTTTTDGFVFCVAAAEPGAPGPLAVRPAADEMAPVFMWKTWETPTYHLRPKAVYDALQRVWRDMNPLP